MALKFLNKKGWHTGSLRNIENVWKAEQKHDAEQKKLEELRKQIQEERERSEFRLLQEQAGLVPKQERLDFLYESGLAVGKASSDGFKALQAPPAVATPAAEASSSKSAVPGALFEDKPQSANDAWRKLHSDPLLLIRQREQEALSRIKNNPIKMAMIKKSVETEKKKEAKKEKREKKRHKKHDGDDSRSDKRRSNVHSDSEDTSVAEEERSKRYHQSTDQREHRKSKHEKHSSRASSDSESVEVRKKNDHVTSKHDKHFRKDHSDLRNKGEGNEDERKKYYSSSEYSKQRYPREVNSDSRYRREEDRRKRDHSASERQHPSSDRGFEKKPSEAGQQNMQQGHSYRNRRGGIPKLSEEERAARLREMQLDAELHEEQRWKRLKKAAEADAQEAMRASSSRGKNFLDDAHKSIYGTEKGGSSTIEESVRRRAYYSQGGSAAHESNAFRR
ncbi:uncharacterized protein [Typha latifolia]|uniref:uncharacterized protein n=1 Tax=Typha latifolia TaxID=4733 RepID=UPI003C2C97C0